MARSIGVPDPDSHSMMPLNQSRLTRVRDASTEDAAATTSILADGGIPSALWGVNAAVHYGGGLCPLVCNILPSPYGYSSGTDTYGQDIELVINDADQELAFAVLTLQGALPAVPEGATETRPADFAHWRELAASYRFYDRRRVRLCTPMYEIPRTGDPVDDALLPFIILYSAAAVGLPPVPFPQSLGLSSGHPYALLSSPGSMLQDPRGGRISLIPTFPYLVKSEMHVLLRHADFLSPVWGQHMAQLSELLRSRSCGKGHDSLTTLANPRLSNFAAWIQAESKGEADYNQLGRLREAYIRAQPEV